MDACTLFVADRASHRRSCIGFGRNLCLRPSPVAALVRQRRYHRSSALGVESSAYALSVNFIQQPLCSVPNAVVRPREALLGGLLTILAFKPALALFAGFSQYFVF